jgi:hypothetical protein
MATYDDLEDWIRTENGNHDSLDDQVSVARWFWDRNLTVVDDRVVRTSQVEEDVEHRLDHQVRTSLDNLEKIGVLVQFDPPGSGSYIRHHRTETNFYDPSARKFVPLLEEELSRFLDDLASRPDQTPQVADGGSEEDDELSSTLRGVAANALGVARQGVESELTDPEDPIERMNRFDTVVKAIKNSEEVSRRRNYDEMGWRNSALRWCLSERAARMEGNQSLTQSGGK